LRAESSASEERRGKADMSRLQERIAVVTGAASGLGLATSKRFAAEGATVVMVDVH
jgi:nucleoside-diphosphate-sugar epimerase